MGKLQNYAREMVGYWRLADGRSSFLRLMQCRLSLSKIGWLICRKRMTPSLALRGFGRSVRMRSHSTDISVLKEIAVSRGYEQIFRFLTQDPKVIVDLGANIGLVSTWLLSRYPDAKLVAVEPEPGNLDILRENLAQFKDRSHIVPACIGASPRRVQLLSSTGEWGYHMDELSDSSSAPSVDVVTMAQALEQIEGKVDLLKCDIEGAEKELFESCQDWISRVRLVVVECHGGYTAADLLAALQRCGARFEMVSHHHSARFRHDTVILKQV